MRQRKVVDEEGERWFRKVENRHDLRNKRVTIESLAKAINPGNSNNPWRGNFVRLLKKNFFFAGKRRRYYISLILGIKIIIKLGIIKNNFYEIYVH